MTWKQKVARLTVKLGRKPDLDELLAAAALHRMSPEEVEEQRQSLARGLEPMSNTLISAGVIGDKRGTLAGNRSE